MASQIANPAGIPPDITCPVPLSSTASPAAARRATASAAVPVARAETLPWVNVLRLAGATGVVLIHVAMLFLTSVEPSSARWWMALAADSAMRWAVPIFLMVSGALLLDDSRRESPLTFYRKRTCRIAIPLVFWALAETAWETSLRCDGLLGFLAKVPSVALTSHLWYLTVALWLYVITPPLRFLLRRLSEGQRWALTVAVLAASEAWIYLANWPAQNWTYLSFYLLGFQLRRVRLASVRSWMLVAAILISLSLLVAARAACWSSFGPVNDNKLFRRHQNPLVIVMAASIFLLVVRRLGSAQPGRWSRVLSWAAPATLGIYLVHPFVQEGLTALGLQAVLPPEAVVPVVWLAVLGVSFALVQAIRCVPLLRRTV